MVFTYTSCTGASSMPSHPDPSRYMVPAVSPAWSASKTNNDIFVSSPIMTQTRTLLKCQSQPRFGYNIPEFYKPPSCLRHQIKIQITVLGVNKGQHVFLLTSAHIQIKYHEAGTVLNKHDTN